MFYGNNHDFLQICTGKSDETENGKKRLFGRWRREMFREIRKKKNAITADAAESLLEKSRRGVLAVNGDDGYPYAIPVNYFYDRNEQKIYFHGRRAQDTRSMRCGLRIRCALRFTEMKRSGRKHGRRICRARSSSADAACLRRGRRRLPC